MPLSPSPSPSFGDCGLKEKPLLTSYWLASDPGTGALLLLLQITKNHNRVTFSSLSTGLETQAKANWAFGLHGSIPRTQLK